MPTCREPTSTRIRRTDYALKDGDTVGAVPYVMERYGIIYNKKLLQKYFDFLGGIKSVDSINNFKTLKTVADEIQAHKDDGRERCSLAGRHQLHQTFR